MAMKNEYQASDVLKKSNSRVAPKSERLGWQNISNEKRICLRSFVGKGKKIDCWEIRKTMPSAGNLLVP
jgi:hypothetical protein